MVTVPLIGGAYQARSPIANQQRCINLYPEKNQADSEVPVTHYQTPGLLTLIGSSQPLAWRGLYLASNGQLFGVRGASVYAISSSWTLTLLGTIDSAASTPVSMIDNTTDLLIVDGSSSGWTVHLADNTFATLTTPNFVGGDFVKFINGFFILNVPGTQQFYTSGLYALTFDALDYANKAGANDKLMGIEANHLELWLIGQKTTEVWGANTSTNAIPFIRIDGVFIEHGTVAKYSIARYDTLVFWLSQDNNGQALVLQGSNYQAQNITTPAISYIISQYATITDAIGFVYQQGNHAFYVLTFPSANATWVYDISTNLWHERGWTDPNGGLNRIRANCTAFAYGVNIVGDFQNGKLYYWGLNIFTDVGSPIQRVRGFPHNIKDGGLLYHRAVAMDISTGGSSGTTGLLINPVTQVPILTQSELAASLGGPQAGSFDPSFDPSFELSGPYQPPSVIQADTPDSVIGLGDMTATMTPLNPGGPQFMPQVSLRWSDDRGFSWGNPVLMPLGAAGDYGFQPRWTDLGVSRDRVYEVSWSEQADIALNGMFLDFMPLGA